MTRREIKVLPAGGLHVLMLLHVVVWGFFWATKGNSVYAALFGFALASLVFMTAWTYIDKVDTRGRHT